MIFGSTSCKLSGFSAKIPIPVNQSSVKPAFHLPLKIQWITELFPDQQQDTYKPVENGSPLVIDDQVFVGTHFGQFLCLDRKTGKVLWRFKAFGGIESAPAIFGDDIIFGDSDGKIYSLRRSDGFANWIYKAQGEIMGQVVIQDDLALFVTTFNRIYAIQAKTGQWVWTHQRSLPEGFSIRGVSSPASDGKLVYAGLADGYLVAVDIKRGREVWKNLLLHTERFTDIDATPILADDKIYVASYDGALYCLSKSDGTIQWKFGRGGISRVTLTENRIFYANNDGFVYSLERDGGKEIWKLDVRDRDRRKSLAKSLRRKLRVPTTPVLYGPYLLTASSDGYLYVLNPDSGKELWRYLPGYGVSSELVVTDDGIYLLTNSAMVIKMAANKYPPPIF